MRRVDVVTPQFTEEERLYGAATGRRPETSSLRAVRQAQRNYLDPVQQRVLMDGELAALTPSEVAGLLNVAEQLRANNTARSVSGESGGGLLAILESRGQAPKRQTALSAELRAAYGVSGPEAGDVYRNPAYSPDASST